MKTFNQLREGLWANIHAKRKRGERMRKKGEKGAPTADAMAKAKAGSKNGSTSQMEDSTMAINPKTVNKTKPMLIKYAKKFGVDLEFGIGGRMPSVLQIKSKSSQAEKGFLDAVGKDKKLMKLLDHVEHDLEEGKGTDAALQKKADASGISKSILKKVYDRGLAAWKVGHKPGTTPQQWGMARVNSFITKGKVWHKYDSDLRKQHQGK